MDSWRQRLNEAERERAANADYWNSALPAIFQDCLVPAAYEFQAAAAEHVQADVTEVPSEFKVVLQFDDWHLGEWSLVIRLLPSTRTEAWLHIACPPDALHPFTLRKDQPCTPDMVLDWMTTVYVERVTRDGPDYS